MTAPQKTAKYNSNNNFDIRETQGEEPWCSSYVQSAAINTFRKAIDTPVTSAQTLMKLKRPGVSDEELKTLGGGLISNDVKILKDKYNIGVTIEDRALNFSEVKKEIDAGQIVEMDAYNINAEVPEEGYGHVLAIVGYVTSNDGDKNKTPYYEVWNPWWASTFYIPASGSTFRLAGIDYKWTRSWYNWRQDGVSSVNDNVGKQPVSNMGKPNSVEKRNLIKQNPLLHGETFYSATNLNSSQDIMEQFVSEFGRETSVNSKTIGATFGYAFSKGSGEYMRARKNSSTKITKNMETAHQFSNSVDELFSSYNTIIGLGIGTAVFMALYIAIQFIPVK
ncbi:C47 family peptidase [Lactococcus chungangensis]|uniref:C47 family peptidase n=1 Tax=Pseudolactococcus chungangensis TaxID=451457 RepID=UPI0028D312A1|nr:C47 family peptidase [Lactococcus chungangensis]